MNNIYDDMVKNNLSEEDPRPLASDFGENATAAMGLFIDENLSFSQYMHLDGIPGISEGITSERNQKIVEARQNGEIPQDVWDHYTSWKPTGDKIDFEGLTDYMRSDLGRTDIMTYNDLFENLRDNLKSRRDYAQGVFENQTSLGAVGEMVGTMGGAALDPVNLAGGFALGARAFAGYSTLQRVGTAFGVGMATEAIIQPHVYAWKGAIDSEYSSKEALLNIIAAGGFNAAAEGVSLGIKAMIKKGFDMTGSGVASDTGTELPTSPGQRKAAADLESAEAGLSPLLRELDNAPLPEMDAAIHAGLVDDADIAINRGVRQPESVPNTSLDELPDADLDAAWNSIKTEKPDMIMDVDPQGNTIKASDVIDELDVQEKRLTGLLECLRGQ